MIILIIITGIIILFFTNIYIYIYIIIITTHECSIVMHSVMSVCVSVLFKP